MSMDDKEIMEQVRDDHFLYNYWQEGGGPLRDFVRAHRAELLDIIENGWPKDREGYDPERDDFDDPTDTGPDYEGDLYLGGTP